MVGTALNIERGVMMSSGLIVLCFLSSSLGGETYAHNWTDRGHVRPCPGILGGVYSTSTRKRADGLRWADPHEPRESKEEMAMDMNLVEKVTSRQIRNDIPNFSAGDTVRVSVRIVENKKERIQAFEGVVISRQGHGVSETFTVRKISSGIGVERIWPINAPSIAKIEVVRHGKVRRAKIHYLRKLSGKAARIKETEAKVSRK